MKILVLSDSHSGLRFMRQAVGAVKPDAVIHLGDYYEDGKVIAGENPGLRFFQVPGNCDLYRSMGKKPETLCVPVDGVTLMLTHGHRQRVKSGLTWLLAEARERGAAAVLYGHTHFAQCEQEADGLWVLNPGTCCTTLGTVGVMTLEDGQIRDCRILTSADLEKLV